MVVPYKLRMTNTSPSRTSQITQHLKSPTGGPIVARSSLYSRFSDRLSVNPEFTRRLVSYQGNKNTPGFRWMKYKEGFSTQLVEHFLHLSGSGAVLDPFSGIGTTALTACHINRPATGIEIMPIGNLVAECITAIANKVDPCQFEDTTTRLIRHIEGCSCNYSYAFPHVRITQGAFSPQIEEEIAKAREYIEGVQNNELRLLFTAACVMILEEVSYTRKDGQYLRWDPRSGRTTSTRLNKGLIPSFSHLLEKRIRMMISDLPTIKSKYAGSSARFIDGSCLHKLRELPEMSFSTVVTSPPYANRYDYTRTYALELAFLGFNESKIKELRQELLSATVENRSKRTLIKEVYDHASVISQVYDLVDNNAALNEVLGILTEHEDELSNPNVINLILNYFTEMAVVICELARVLTRHGQVFMVNDNVRYHGEEVPVDLILSEIAEEFGFKCKAIWALPRGKGNSSQQMGKFGRLEIRKCVYHWEKT